MSRVDDADVCLGGCDPYLCAVGKQCIFLEEPGEGGATTVLLPDRKIPCRDLMMMMMKKEQGATLKRMTRKMVIPYKLGDAYSQTSALLGQCKEQPTYGTCR